MCKKEQWYAVIGGCVGAVVTMAVCSVMPIGAQSGEDAIFRKITCEELEVVSSIGSVTISDSMIHVKSALPSDIIRGTLLEGYSRSTLIADGSIAISGDDEDGDALVEIKNKEYGGEIVVFGKGSEYSRVSIGVNKCGNGVVSTRDKNGYRLSTLK